MLRRLLPAAVLAFVLAPAASAEVSLGYAYLRYTGDPGQSTPLGFYLSAGRADAGTGFALDLGYHRDGDTELNTFTAQAGPRFRTSGGGFLQVLGGLRHDSVGGNTNTAFGGQAGLGVDLKTGGAYKIRLGADYQIFWDNGDSLKTLRFTAGLTF